MFWHIVTWLCHHYDLRESEERSSYSQPSTAIHQHSCQLGQGRWVVATSGSRMPGGHVRSVWCCECCLYNLHIWIWAYLYYIYSTIQTCNVYPWPCQKKMSCTSVPPIPSLKWLKQTDTIGMLCRIFQQSLTFQAMRQHVLAAQHDLHWSADHRGRPVFLVNPLFIIVQRRAGPIWEQGAAVKNRAQQTSMYETVRESSPHGASAALTSRLAYCCSMIPQKDLQPNSQKRNSQSENWTGFLQFQMGHEGISTEYAYIILHLFLILHHFWSGTNCWFICFPSILDLSVGKSLRPTPDFYNRSHNSVEFSFGIPSHGI